MYNTDMTETVNKKPGLSRWKIILNIVTVLLLVALVYGSREQLMATLSNLRHINGYILLLIIPIEALNYHAQAKVYQHLFRVVGAKLNYRYLYRTALELNFVNYVFPSGGAAGTSYFGITVRNGGEVTAGKATLVHLIKMASVFISLEILIAFGLLALAIGNRVNGLLLLVTAVLSTVVLLVTLAVPYILGSKQRINALVTSVTKILNKVIHIVQPNRPETIKMDSAKSTLNDFHDDYNQLKSKWRMLRTPLMYSLLANATEILALYVVYIAFGEYVNIGAVILAYAVANFAGLVSVLPGGVGIYESLMIAVMASAGVPPGISLPVIVTFRVVSTAIQIPTGYFLYQASMRKRGMTKTDLTNEGA